jgi:hypothetical protein
MLAGRRDRQATGVIVTAEQQMDSAVQSLDRRAAVPPHLRRPASKTGQRSR